MIFATVDPQGDFEDAGFGYGDHLLLWAWRRIAYGRAGCPLLAREFADSFGEEAAEVLGTLQVFLEALNAGASYRLTLGMPGGFALTRDENRVLRLLTAAQSGQAFLFERSLDLLVRQDLRHVVAITARALAKAFALNNLPLSVPALEPTMVCPQQALAG